LLGFPGLPTILGVKNAAVLAYCPTTVLVREVDRGKEEIRLAVLLLPTLPAICGVKNFA